MPFGLMFGAVTSLVLSLWLGFTYWQTGRTPLQFAALALLVLGVSLSLGLLRRQPVARWTGVVLALFFAAAGLGNAFGNAGLVVYHTMWLAALAMLVLLCLPATGRAKGSSGRILGSVALAALVVVIGLYGWDVATVQSHSAALRPDYIRPRVAWQDFGPALEKARAEGKPIFVDFFADWCGPCHKMDRETFRDDRVVERLSAMIPVRVDSEETDSRHGFVGAELAERYGVMSYPTLMLLDPEGNVLSRVSGYKGARKLLRWLDEHAGTEYATKEETKTPLAM